MRKKPSPWGFEWKRIVFDTCIRDDVDKKEVLALRDQHPQCFPASTFPFAVTHWEKVRMVLMVDEPYMPSYDGFSIGHVKDTTGSPPTLAVLGEYNKAQRKRFNLLKTRRWAKEEGVFLPFFNMSPQDSYIYDRIAYRSVRSLALNKDRMVFVFHGDRSEALKPLVTNPDHLVICGIKGSNMFPRIEDYYRDNPIQWRM